MWITWCRKYWASSCERKANKFKGKYNAIGVEVKTDWSHYRFVIGKNLSLNNFLSQFNRWKFFGVALKMSELINSWAFMQWSKSHILNYLSWISGFIWRFSHQSNERFEIEIFIASATKSISRENQFLSFTQHMLSCSLKGCI